MEATEQKANGKRSKEASGSSVVHVNKDLVATKKVKDEDKKDNVITLGAPKSNRVMAIPLADIAANPKLNEREETNLQKPDAEFVNLAISIRERGLIEPVVVRKVGKDKFELVAGYRRFAAHQAFEGADEEGRKHAFEAIPTITATVYEDLTDLEIALTRAAENFVRKDLSTFEKALTVWNIKRLTKEAGVHKGEGATDMEIGRMLNYDRSTVHNMLAWQNLIAPFRRELEIGTLMASEANRFCYKDKDEQKSLYEGWKDKQKTREDEGDLDKKKGNKRNTGARMQRKDAVELLLLEYHGAEEVRAGGKFVENTPEMKAAIKSCLRWILGETDRYPLKKEVEEEESDDE